MVYPSVEEKMVQNNDQNPRAWLRNHALWKVLRTPLSFKLVNLCKSTIMFTLWVLFF